MKPSGFRISITRVLALLLAVVLVVLAVRWFASHGLQKPATPATPAFAGYVDVTATPTYAFSAPADAAQSNVVLAFIVAATDDPCTPTWGTFYTLEAANTALDLDRRIAQLRDVGGSVAVSFGGALNNELAFSCTDPAALQAAYQSVIDRYHLDRIDLDIEGPALADVASQQRRASAVAAVQKASTEAGRPLQVWLTLPVDPRGLTDDGQRAVRQLTAAGVTLAGVNGMAMNFSASKDPDTAMSSAVVSAGTALRAQLADLLPNSTWAQVGLTVMIGQNDVPGEVFTLEDARVVNEFAMANGVGWLSMWSLNRDQTCQPPLPKTVDVVQTDCSGVDQEGFSYAEILADGTDTSLVTPTTPAAPTPAQAIVDDPKTSPYPIWDPNGTYPGATRVVWKREVYQARYWTTGVTPGSVPAGGEDPWTLIGPVLPGDTPAPLPTLPAGTYPRWSPKKVYNAGQRVQLDNVPYEAKWWTRGQKPGVSIPGGSPWTLITPG